MRRLILLTALLLGTAAYAEDKEQRQHQTDAEVAELTEPLYNPFVERYVLDELKALRNDMHRDRVDLIEQFADRQISAVDKAVSYSYDTVTYFFYLIAAVSSIMVIVGWNSLREIKAKVHTEASSAVEGIVEKYEMRLLALEQQLHSKSKVIDANREEIERNQERHALWLRASQESLSSNKIPLYDQILALAPNDGEALTYKADAALEMDEPQWAISLCQQALKVEPDNAHAYYQLACAYSCMQQLDEASRYFLRALAINEAYRDELDKDPALEALRGHQALLDALLPGRETPLA